MNWDEYLYGFAVHASLKSKDSTKVGAVLIGHNKEVLITGYNGFPMNVEDKESRFIRPVKYLFVQHAERNVINFAARNGIKTDGCTLYTTHCCCAGCMGAIIQSGITSVFYGPGTTSMPESEFIAAQEMANEAKILYLPIS